MVNNWLKNIQQGLFPPLCLLCDAPVSVLSSAYPRWGVNRWAKKIHSAEKDRAATNSTDMDLCAGCAKELPYIENACPGCGIALPPSQSEDSLCGRCLQQRPAFAVVKAVFHYQPPLAGLIMGLKFNGQLSHARLLGQLMAERLLADNDKRPDLLLPVPLHRRRLRQRGFNQSLELAHHIGRRLAVPVWADACRRQRDTASQSSLPAKERRGNIRNAFIANRSLQGRHVAIIDDVMTTGCTVQELTLALKRAGARRVDVWVCARVTI